MTGEEKKDLLKDEEDEKDKKQKDARKVEHAKKIAAQTKRVAESYEHLEAMLVRIFHFFSTLLDKILFNRKHSRIIALVLAVLLYAVVNYNDMAKIYTTSLQSSKQVTDVAVTARYNEDTFELSGLPSTADITITGDATSVTNAASSTSGTIVADLEGLTEGQHEVKLTAEGYSSGVNVVIDPSTAVITLKKKTTKKFDISYDFINTNKMDDIYSLGTPQFDSTKVNVRASSDTLDSISFVKALIDVSGQTSDFETDAKLVAYDADGNTVKADIVPETVHVSVPVTSSSKTVPVEVQVSGEVPDDQAIESITMDQQNVTIYGSESVLASIDSVAVTLDASTLTKNATVLRPIVLPSGVSSSNVSQITMTVTMGKAVEKTVDNVPINVKNNNNHYKASQPDNITTASVTVKGTENNINSITADDISVYIDMSKAEPGVQTFKLHVDQPDSGLAVYILTDTEYELNVLGETTDDTSDTDEGTNVNND